MATPQLQRQSITRAMMRTLLRFLIPFLGRPAGRDLVERIANDSFVTVLSTRKQYEALARELYIQSLAAFDRDADPVSSPSLRPFTFAEWLGSVRRSLVEDEPIDMKSLESLLVGADLHSRNAEREHAVAYAIDDPRSIGWARYDPIPGTCSWCLMLISRGPSYGSNMSAGGMEKWHRGCTCEVVQVFSRDKWRGKAQYEQAEQLWKDVTKGKKGNDATRAFRRAVEAGRPKASKQVSRIADQEMRNQARS